MDEPTDLQAIVLALANTWLTKPQASDTADGIGRWWFDREGIVAKNELVKALDWMVQQKLIAQFEAADGRCRYFRIASDSRLNTCCAGALPN